MPEKPKYPIEVPNKWGLGVGALPLIVEGEPDLDRIFNDADPPLPQAGSDEATVYWSRATVADRRHGLALAYLGHPDAEVRRITIGVVRRIDGVGQGLVDALADDDLHVRKAAAKAIWEQQGEERCAFTVRCLRDEIRGHHTLGPSGPTAVGLTLGREKAIRGLDLLVEEAPDHAAASAIQQLIDLEVVIPERVKPSNEPAVFVEVVRKDEFTYEVYRASTKQAALAFLKEKLVNRDFYYVEVETPEGTFGRDIDGMYET